MQFALVQRRRGRQVQRRLGDEVVGVVDQLFAEGLDLRLGRGRSHQHAVAAGTADLLHHQLVQLGQHLFQRLRLAATPGRDILQDRLLAGEEADDLGHVGIDGLVVGHAGPDRIGEGHGPGLIGRHQAGHPQSRVWPEGQGIQIIVVDAAVDDVDLLSSLGRAHEDLAVVDEQVAPLDQIDPQFVGQEGVFIVGRVERSRRQHDDGRISPRRLGCRGAQAGQQHVGVCLDRPHRIVGEQVGEQPHHHLAVLQHVGDPRRRAAIVFQHVEAVLARADQIDAGDMHPDPARRPPALHLGHIVGIGQDQFGRDDARLQAFLRPVDVGQEQVHGPDPLDQPGLQPGPFRRADDARHDVERDQPLAGLGVAIDGEGDAHAAEEQLRLPRAGLKQSFGCVRQPAGEPAIAFADAPAVT